MKFIETDEEIVNMIEEAFGNAHLDNLGLGLRVLSVDKAKDVLKVSKASATTNYLTNYKVDLTVFVYQEAFNRLDEKTQRLLVEMMMTNVSYDLEKEKLNIDSNPFNQIFGMSKKYGNEVILNALELSYLVIKQIEEEYEEKKRMAKEAKASKKKNG